MKAEIIPQDLWQRHELEWQALRARPVADRFDVIRRERDRDEELERRVAREH